MDLDLLTGRIFDHLEIRELIGSGAMGEVYRAFDSRPHLDREVAVKRIRPELVQDPRTAPRLLREPRIAAQIVHPYVATVFDVLDTEVGPLLVMEYIEGKGMDKVIRKGPPEPSRLIGWAVELAEALDAIHSRGLVHRDLKPGNVMITEGDHVKVVDFGLARVMERPVGPDDPTRVTDITQGNELLGTVNYMSPEQLRLEELDPRSDLFSLGVMLYEALTGDHPFRKPSMAETQSAILSEAPSGGQYPAKLAASGPLRKVILRLLNKNREERYPSAAELLLDLKAIAAGAVVMPMRRWWSLTAVLLVVAVVVAWWLIPPPELPPEARPTPSRPAVAVLPIIADEPGLAGRVSYLLGTSLGESREIRSISGTRVEEALEGIGDAAPEINRLQRVVRLLPVSWVITGRVYREGDRFIFAAIVHASSTFEELGHLRVESERTTGLVDAAAIRVLELIAAGPGGISISDLPAIPQIVEAALEEFNIARRLNRKQEYDAAREALERALDLQPDFSRAAVLEADILNDIGYEARARERIASALRMARGRPSFGERRGDLELQAAHARIQGHKMEAVEACRLLVDRYPGDPEALSHLADALRADGDTDQALLVLDQAIEIDPGDPRLHLARMRVLSGLRRLEEAAGSLDTAREAYDLLGAKLGPAELAKASADLAYWRGDSRAAADAYREAHAAYTVVGARIPAASAMVSEAAVRTGIWELEQAGPLFDEALPVLRDAGYYSKILALLSNKTALLIRQRSLDDAETVSLQAMDEARKLERLDWQMLVLNNLSRVLTLAGRPAEGEDRARTALEIEESHPSPYSRGNSLLFLAEALWHQGKFAQSVLVFRQVREIPPSTNRFRGLHYEAFSGEADARAEEGQLDLALEATDQALALAKELDNAEDIGFSYIQRSRILALLDRDDEARVLLKKGRRLLGPMVDRPAFAAEIDGAERALE